MTASSNHQPHTPTLALLVAASTNDIIGIDGRLPWHLPDDLAHFKRLTTGHTIVMGRKTFDSIGRPLPHRQNIVLTRDPRWQAPGVGVAHTLDQAIAAATSPDIFIIGGAQVYWLAMPRAHRLYLTRVHVELAGDASFTGFDPAQWRLIDSIDHPADDRHEYAFTIESWQRCR